MRLGVISNTPHKTALEVCACSAAVFAYLFLTSPFATTALAGLKIHFFFAAPMAAAGLSCSIQYLLKGRYALSSKYLLPLTLFSIPAALSLFKVFQSSMDSEISRSSSFTSYMSIEEALHFVGPWHELGLLFSVCLPFFFYGPYLASKLNMTPRNSIWKIYGSELLGLMFGAIVSTLGLDYISLSFVFISLAFLAGAAFLLANQKVTALCFCISFLLLSLLNPSPLEPNRNIHWSARDLTQTADVTELDSAWTTYAKVQWLRISRIPGWYYEVISLGDGSGHAIKTVFEGAKHFVPKRLPESLISPFRPRTSLVLFAGAGADIISLSKLLPYHQKIIGVELNPRLLEFAQRENPLLNKLLKSETVQLVNSEARTYLERTAEKFDAILYSWSGATISNSHGVALHTTQYAMTTEAISRAYGRLNYEGVLALLGGSKVNIFLSLLEARSHDKSFDPKKSILLVAPSGVLDNGQMPPESLIKPWDNYGFIIKKGALTKAEVSALEQQMGEVGYQIVVSPFTNASTLVSQVFSAKTITEAKSILKQISSQDAPESFGDDQPFVYKIEPRIPKSILGVLNHWSKKTRLETVNSREFLGALFFLLTLVLFIKVWISSVKQHHAAKGLLPIVSSSLLGFYSTALAMLITTKAILFIGSPTYAMAFTQVSFFIGGGIGAILYTSKAKLIHYTSIVLGLLACFLWLPATVFYSDLFFNALLGPLALALLIIPSFILSSSIFTYNLSHTNLQSDVTPGFHIAINLLSSSSAAFLLPVFIENWGLFSSSLLIQPLLVLALIIRLEDKWANKGTVL